MNSKAMKTITRVALVLCNTLAAPTAWAQGQVVEYYHLDALGTVRVVTEGSSTVLERHDYLPFGEELCPSGGTFVVCGTAPAGQSKRFTGKERDTETGLDYFGARYYGSKTGRFTTIDPVFTWQENLRDPQRWNRYAYARNNPLKFVDPDGRVILPALLVVWGAVEVGLQIYDSYSTVQTLSDPNASFRDKAIAGGGFVVGAIAPGGAYGAAGKAAAGKLDDAARAGKSLAEQAADLVPLNGGRNRVTLRSPSKKLEIDLAGKSHAGVPTPHTKASDRNLNAPNQPAYDTRTAPVEASTQADIRLARRYLESKKKGGQQ